MRTGVNRLLLAVVLSLTGCATIELTSEGSKVLYVKQFPSYESPGTFEELGTLSCSKGWSGREPGDNVISCRTS